MSVRRFKVDTKVDRARQVTVEITPTAGGTDAIFSVRPKHQRNRYTIMLSEVVLMAVARSAKQTLASQGIPVPMARKLKG
jgi:hypothetical protein